ncbi:PilW family protein [uncultured Pseudacidovorax sp.]|uniref:PilW family protein n=1 Tax=uncultured Pseudacidovorax sp. TaxID=679313 RepID=UPI0025CF5C1A|nr:PilW family protein [uncultured Pseudacidovorax sp.]
MRQKHPRRAPQRQEGASLVELLLGAALGLTLVLLAVQVYVSTGQPVRRIAAQVQLYSDGAMTLQLLAQQLRLTGLSELDDQGNPHFQGLAVRGCAGAFADTSAAFDALACKAPTADARPHAFAIRHQADAHVTVPVGADQPSNCVLEGIAAWATSSADSAVRYPLADQRYFIEPDEDGVPTLYCRGMRDAGVMGSKQAIASQVEDMRVSYAVTKLPDASEPQPVQVTAYVRADDPALGAASERWRRVIGMSLCIVVRSASPVIGAQQPPEPYVDCDGQPQQAKDGRLRRSFRMTAFFHALRPALDAGTSS